MQFDVIDCSIRFIRRLLAPHSIGRFSCAGQPRPHLANRAWQLWHSSFFALFSFSRPPDLQFALSIPTSCPGTGWSRGSS